MTKGDKRWVVAGAGVLLAFLVVHHARDRGAQAGTAAEAAGQRWRAFAAGVPGLPASDGEPAAAAVDAAMVGWRNAIIVMDADAVATLDRAFNETPARYAPALIKAAETDDNERVRAFSVRVLGRFKAAALADLFAHLLEDRSPYVREAAQRAIADLQRPKLH
jgi:HEAT repeat protein